MLACAKPDIDASNVDDTGRCGQKKPSSGRRTNCDQWTTCELTPRDNVDYLWDRVSERVIWGGAWFQLDRGLGSVQCRLPNADGPAWPDMMRLM